MSDRVDTVAEWLQATFDEGYAPQGCDCAWVDPEEWTELSHDERLDWIDRARELLAELDIE